MTLASAQSIQSGGATGPYRVMVVDDSAVIRGIFRRTLDVDPDITIVASVGNGQHAVDSLARHPVDVIVLDIEMPVMDGMTALPKLLKIDPEVKIIMASTLTQANADISLQALSAGAADYIPKPTAKHEIHSADAFKRELLDKVKALGQARRSKRRVRGRVPPPGTEKAKASSPGGGAARARTGNGIVLRRASVECPKILCIGSSTGGPKALIEVIGGLRVNFDLPILITQHMPSTFTSILADHLCKAAGRPAAEGVDGERVQPGHIYVAPGGIHMVVDGTPDECHIRLQDDPPENFCKPAVDPMLRSVAKIFGGYVLTVILTGMGHDGRVGGTAVVEAGGSVVVQDEETSVVWGMPGAAANAGICSAVLPLSQISLHVRKLAGRPVA